MKTLFAHLALGFSRHPENLATEALGYMLQSSPTAARALEARLRSLASPIPSDLQWRTQVGGNDDARPDLVGNDSGGVPRVIIEAKFWAGLTENQPTAYLKRLPPGGVLCVMGPAKRHSLLVGELARRIVDARLTYQEAGAFGDATVASIGESTLVVVSWRVIVEAIIAQAEHTGERDLAENAASSRVCAMSRIASRFCRCAETNSRRTALTSASFNSGSWSINSPTNWGRKPSAACGRAAATATMVATSGSAAWACCCCATFESGRSSATRRFGFPSMVQPSRNPVRIATRSRRFLRERRVRSSYLPMVIRPSRYSLGLGLKSTTCWQTSNARLPR
jgi:hypothetical protein